MKRWWWLIVVYLIAMVVFLPAKVVYWAPLPSNVSLTQAQGTLWQGSLGEVQVQGVSFNNVAWDWHVSDLLLGKVTVDINIPERNNSINLDAMVSAGLSSVAVQQLDAAGELNTLLHLSGVKMPLKTQGQWQLSLTDYKVKDPTPTHLCDQLTGSARGDNIQVLVNNMWQGLGDFPVTLGCAKAGAITLAMNGNNSMGLDFTGSINAEKIAASGTVRPNPETPEALAKMIAYLGRPDSQGRYRFSL